MRELSLHYIAGAMDGDGSFSLIRKIDGSSICYYPLIQFSNANEVLCVYFKCRFGGSVVKRESWIAKDGGRRKSSFTWKADKKVSHPFIKEICPFLVLKKRRAQLLLDYISSNPFKRGMRITKEKQLVRKSIWLRIKSMNSSIDISDRLLVEEGRCISSDENFWKYCAGLMDTDGSFSIKKEIGKSRKGTYSPVILISMCWSESIVHLYNNSGVGSLCIVKAATARSGQCFRFGVYSKKEVCIFLKKIIPYLINKHKKASILLEFCEGYVPQQGLYLKTEKQQLFREDCYKRLIESDNMGSINLL